MAVFLATLSAICGCAVQTAPAVAPAGPAVTLNPLIAAPTIVLTDATAAGLYPKPHNARDLFVFTHELGHARLHTYSEDAANAYARKHFRATAVTLGLTRRQARALWLRLPAWWRG